MKRFLIAPALFALCPTLPVAANDSSAAIGLGGLELQKNDAISMDSEDLFLSMEQVRVKYRFTNNSAKDVELLVSFPLPALPSGIQGYLGDTSYPDWKELKFRTLIDGKETILDYHEVVTAKGKNVEGRLKQLGWPIKYWDDYEFQASFDKMEPTKRDAFVKEGLLFKPDPEYDAILPAWQVATHVTRKQVFPAGKTVTVEHSYKPLPGGSVGGMLGMIAEGSKEDYVKQYAAAYCIDQSFITGFRNKMTAKRKENEKREAETGVYYVEYWLDYVLKSGANWKGPIRDFRMVVDKGNKGNLISLCADGIRKISPTQFEIRKTDFKPRDDIRILIVSPPESE